MTDIYRGVTFLCNKLSYCWQTSRWSCTHWVTL